MSWTLEFVICAARGFGERKIFPRLAHARLTHRPEEPKLVTYVCRSYAEFCLLNQGAVKKNLLGNQLWTDVRYRNTVTGELRKPQDPDRFQFLPADDGKPAVTNPHERPSQEGSEPGANGPGIHAPPPAGETGSGQFSSGPPPLPLANPPFGVRAPQCPPVTVATPHPPPASSKAAKRQSMRSGKVGGGTVKGGAPPKPPKPSKTPVKVLDESLTK